MSRIRVWFQFTVSDLLFLVVGQAVVLSSTWGLLKLCASLSDLCIPNPAFWDLVAEGWNPSWNPKWEIPTLLVASLASSFGAMFGIRARGQIQSPTLRLLLPWTTMALSSLLFLFLFWGWFDQWLPESRHGVRFGVDSRPYLSRALVGFGALLATIPLVSSARSWVPLLVRSSPLRLGNPSIGWVSAGREARRSVTPRPPRGIVRKDLVLGAKTVLWVPCIWLVLALGGSVTYLKLAQWEHDLVKSSDWPHPYTVLSYATDKSYFVLPGTCLSVEEPGVLAYAKSYYYPPHAVLARRPNHGTLVFRSDGSFDYTPQPLFEGLDSFSFQVSDRLAPGCVATVLIMVTSNMPPPFEITLSNNRDQSGEIHVGQRGLSFEAKPLNLQYPWSYSWAAAINGSSRSLGTRLSSDEWVPERAGTYTIQVTGKFLTPSPHTKSAQITVEVKP